VAPSSFSIAQLYKKIDDLLAADLSFFRGLILSGVSIEEPLLPKNSYGFSFFTGTSSLSGKSYKISIHVHNKIINEYRKSVGEEIPAGAQYDLTIDEVKVSAN